MRRTQEDTVNQETLLIQQAEGWRFGPFVLWESPRRLERSGAPVRLGTRSIELLLELIKGRNEHLTKEQLLERVWAGADVDEVSVRVHMSTLRKALGPPGDHEGCHEWISTAPMRGYRFIGKVERATSPWPGGPSLSGRSAEHPDHVPCFRPSRLPSPISRLIGRETEIRQLHERLLQRRLVTVAGPGGIGKTCVAVHVARLVQQETGSEVTFVDLAPLVSADHLLSAVAQAVGLPGDGSNSSIAIARGLSGRSLLLLVDNCEHVVTAVARLVEELLVLLPELKVLATSRERLRVQGEHVVRLPPLSLQAGPVYNIRQAMRSAAVELLIDLSTAAGAPDFEDAEAELLTRLCRNVDGIPLAIQLIAARLPVQSARSLAEDLDGHLQIYSMGNRSEQKRHRTLAATLDWSTALLTTAELRLFCRPVGLSGRFDAESALAIVDGELDADIALDALASLVDKSLVAFDHSHGSAAYRLLDTTRGYAQKKLTEGGAWGLVCARHAHWMLSVMRAANVELTDVDMATWIDRYAHRIDDVRFALDSNLEARGELTVASGPLWIYMSQLAEFRTRARAALEHASAQIPRDEAMMARLQIALSNAIAYTDGATSECVEACEQALVNSVKTATLEVELESRWRLVTLNMVLGNYARSLWHAERLDVTAKASGDPIGKYMAARMMAYANHFCGNFRVSRAHVVAAASLGYIDRLNPALMLQSDPRTTPLCSLGRTLWIMGEEDKAMEAATRVVEYAEDFGQVLGLIFALYWACPVAVWAGRHDVGRRWIERMREVSQRRGLDYWHKWVIWFDYGLRVRMGEDRERVHQEVVTMLPRLDTRTRDVLVTFCEDWFDDEMLVRVERGEGQWCAAEVWRAAGVRRQRDGDRAGAERLFRMAVDKARAQCAVAWQRRAEASLVALGAQP
ncbi:ATP-binding protein [Variovorax sp. UC122_21]|uniref:ATP-binding protein n=1 Tax=Variovorax sp. UC122_21 TaxID=3374554 RepID=UPI0037576A6A